MLGAYDIEAIIFNRHDLVVCLQPVFADDRGMIMI
jgi:hypothetical protein